VNPAEMLTAAADRVRDLAAAATPGPWFTHDTHLNAGGHTATVLSGTYPEGQLRAWLPTWSHEPWDETRNVWNDARWIAALSPAVAPAIIGLLVSSSEHIPVCGAPARPCRFCAPALALANRILGVDTP
jgi:hypothetical protein